MSHAPSITIGASSASDTAASNTGSFADRAFLRCERCVKREVSIPRRDLLRLSRTNKPEEFAHGGTHRRRRWPVHVNIEHVNVYRCFYCPLQSPRTHYCGGSVLQLDGSAPIFSPRSARLFILSLIKIPGIGGNQSPGIETIRTSTSALRLSREISAIA